ncbi:MAG: heme ABC exporter ATP-binding protein CcmA, partial [Hyphomicrobiaceae bacterium]
MALRIENLTVRRGERAVLSGLSLRVERGEGLLLTGANGVGKTTLIRAVAGLLPIANGVIALDGTGAEDGSVGEQSHFVGHLNGVKPALTVAENALFWARYLGGSTNNVAAALDQFRLTELAPIRAGYLSAGQKRRLGLSRLLVARRPVWLMDEPAVSLDTASQNLLAEAVNRHLADGGIVVAATHQALGFSPAREH